MTPEERAAWKAHDAESEARLRRLRELIALGEAELTARRKIDPNYGRPPGARPGTGSA